MRNNTHGEAAGNILYNWVSSARGVGVRGPADQDHNGIEGDVIEIFLGANSIKPRNFALILTIFWSMRTFLTR